MGCADGQMQQSCAEDDGSGGEISRETVNGFDFENFRAHRLDNLPAANGCAERHRGRCRNFNPKRYFETIQMSGSDESKGDNPHGLLRVVRTMCKRLRCSRKDLHGAEAFVDGMRTLLRKNPFEDRHNDITDDKCNKRRQQKSFHDFNEPAPFEVIRTGSNKHRTGQSTDQRMRGGGRNAQPPGRQIPDNRSKQCGGNHFQAVIERSRICNAAADFLRNTREENGAEEIHECCQNDRRTRFERTSRYRGCNRIGCIMETVNEVKRQRKEDNNAYNEK